jgi:DNA-binding transcriptional regulator GbsR (MarR family)
MDYQEGKMKFIQSWGTMGSGWGISRAMAEVHALLLISQEPLTTDGVMEALKISRGSANTNIRELIDWGLVYKVLRQGERKEYFEAEKDLWKVMRQIVIQRKKKELEPMLKVLDEVSAVHEQCPDSDEFCRMVREIKLFSSKANTSLDRLIKSDSNWFLKVFMEMIR